MTLLIEEDRRELWAKFMKEASAIWEKLDLSKSDLRAAVDATDQWIEDNQASFNQALPLPARTALTQKQKVRLFMEVAKRKYEVT